MNIRESIVAVLNGEGKIVGTGFLASETLILTCAHVVVAADAIGGDTVQVCFDGQMENLNAFVMPEYFRGADKGDVAVLRLETVPQGVKPLPLASAAGSAGHDFYAYGYAIVTDVQGIGARGKIVDIVDNGRLVQLTSQEPDHGMSGGPVLDEQRLVVIGMVTKGKGLLENQNLRNTQTTFATSIEVIRDICSNLNILSEARENDLAILYNVPDLPDQYLTRQEDLVIIKEMVLSMENKSIGIVGKSLKVGLQGMGGIGKSMMAAILAHDEDIRSKFHDGVIWITLGEKCNITVRQSQLAETLGEKERNFKDPQDGKTVLQKLFIGKSCFLILDDVWKVNDAAAFDIVGEKSQIMLTTRDLSIVDSLSAAKHTLNVLSKNQSLELLAHWAEQPVNGLPEEAFEIAKECGYLPLGLAMIGALVKRNRENWQRTLYRLKNADLEKISYQFPNYPYPDLMSAIKVSVDALSDDFRARYLEFGIFAEDIPIPKELLERFWKPLGLNEFDIADMLDAFVDRALLFCDEENHFSLHDLQHDYVRKQVENLPKLRDRLLIVNAKELGAIRETVNRFLNVFVEIRLQDLHKPFTEKRFMYMEDELHKIYFDILQNKQLLCLESMERVIIDLEEVINLISVMVLEIRKHTPVDAQLAKYPRRVMRGLQSITYLLITPDEA